jgi:hypothetical protein
VLVALSGWPGLGVVTVRGFDSSHRGRLGYACITKQMCVKTRACMSSGGRSGALAASEPRLPEQWTECEFGVESNSYESTD